ncbi:MAG: hypothetical protein IJ409_02650 [Lachnospiraceae bacterium]|nr:hypothetical protein [Lachnospiraceae bacterium]
MAQNMPEVKEEQKVQTKYDRKMEARKKQKEQDIKEEKRDKFFGIFLIAAILLVVAIVIIVPIVKKNSALKDTYAKIGEHEVTKLEYDYYYQTVVSNYLTQYSTILPYMGLDTSLPYEDQIYVDNKTWKDFFDEMTIDQIARVKVMYDEAKAAGYEYDIDTEYATFVENVAAVAESAGVSVKEYYKNMCGAYATEENVADFVKEGIYADAYYNKMLGDYAPTEEEVTAYYQENALSYDQVDYRSFAFNAELAEDASEEEVSKAMEELSVKAEAMKAELEAGAVFEELCIANAAEADKASYEDETTELCLTEGGYYMGTNTAISDWLYEDGRTEGDLTVIYDEAGRRYFVVEFVQRYYDEANNTGISSMIAEQDVTVYLNEKLASYEVVDVKGELKYLTLEDTAETATEESAAE